MYTNISRQAYRNLMEFRLHHKIELTVGLKVALLKSRKDNESGQEVYSLTTDCEITSINPVRIYGSVNVTIKPDGQDPLYLDYKNGYPTESKSAKYTFTTRLLQLPDEIDLSRVLNGKLYYIMLTTSVYVGGAKISNKFEVPVFGYDENDAFKFLKSNTETELSLGNNEYRLVDTSDPNSPFSLRRLRRG